MLLPPFHCTMFAFSGFLFGMEKPSQRTPSIFEERFFALERFYSEEKDMNAV